MPKILKLLTCIVFISVVSFVWTGLAQARVYIDITKPSTRKLPLAMPDFTPLAALTSSGAQGLDILKNDLLFTGLFDILDPATYLGGAGQEINPRQWSRIGAELLVACSYEQQGDNLTMECRLFDVVEGKMLVGRRYDGTVKDLEAMMHRFADEIMLVLTGERSVFSTLLAFVNSNQGKKEIWVAGFDGASPRQLTFKGDLTLYPAWSPDGNLLAYSSYLNRRPVVYVHALKGGEGRAIVNRPGVNLTPAFRTNAELALAASFSGRTNIYLADAAGNLGANLTDGFNIDVHPTFSPDGRQMAFVSDRGGAPQIYIRDMTTGQIRRLTYGMKYCAAPHWSPRGDRIAFQTQVDGIFQVATISPEGNDLQILNVGRGGGEDPSWSPDGRLIAYSGRKTGRYQIYVMTSDGQPIRQITNLPGDNTDPAWSPRGVAGR